MISNDNPYAGLTLQECFDRYVVQSELAKEEKLAKLRFSAAARIASENRDFAEIIMAGTFLDQTKRYIPVQTMDGDLMTFDVVASMNREQCADRLIESLMGDLEDGEGNDHDEVIKEAREFLSEKNIFTYETTEYAIVEVTIQ